MRWNGCLISIVLASMISASPGVAANFGTVVPIGGHASDIALDEARGVLYIANFTANRIEIMSTADFSIRSSMNVSPQPGAIAISPDNKYLIVAHYGNVTPADPSRNALTLINLEDNTRQMFTTGDTPLAATFLSDKLSRSGMALIVTTTSFLLMDPVTGAISTSTTFANLASSLPTNPDTFPGQVIAATLSTNASRTVAYGLAVVASPKPLARIGVSADGTWALAGLYKVDRFFNNVAQLPNAIAST